MDLRFVALSEIDLADSCFEIRKFTVPLRFEESLARFGILEPPWLREKGGRHIVVDGFKRLRWAEKNAEQGTVCRIFPEDCSDRELWTMRIEKRLFESGLDIAEKAQIISILLGLFQSGEVPEYFLSALGVANRPDFLRRWASLRAAGPQVLEILATGIICERAALELADWDAVSMNAVLRILLSLRCSASIQVEIVERIAEIAIRDGKGRCDVIESAPAGEILGSKELNHRQKTQALRNLLAELRFPRLSSEQKRFRLDVQSLGLPPQFRIIPPPAFEGDTWKMELSFTGPDKLREILASVGSAAASGRLDAVLGPRPRGAKGGQSR
jgi:ParB family chromosome partitioning protein